MIFIHIILIIIAIGFALLYRELDKIPIKIVEPPKVDTEHVTDTSSYDYRLLVARSQDQYHKEEYGRTILQEALLNRQSNPPVEWYQGCETEPSPAEQLIIIELLKYKIRWHREVSFKKLVLPTGGMARVDFYLPDHKTVIEYNSKQWHSTEDRIAVDNIKKEFCKSNKLKLIVYNHKDYYNMVFRIKGLMEQIGISRK